VAISCSFRPIAVDIQDVLPLCEAITRTEVNLASIVENYSKDHATFYADYSQIYQVDKEFFIK
jgi:hypothetical protein